MIPTEQRPTTEILVDRHLAIIAAKLESNVSWLDKAYVRAFRHRRKDNNSIEPFVYLGNDEYLPVMADDTLGNYCFHYVEDGGAIQDLDGVDLVISNVRLIFYFDYSKIYSNPDDYNVMNMIKTVKDVLNSSRPLYGRLDLQAHYIEADQIYRGFSMNNIDDVALMYPFGGFRLDFQLKSLDIPVNCL